MKYAQELSVPAADNTFAKIYSWKRRFPYIFGPLLGRGGFGAVYESKSLVDLGISVEDEIEKREYYERIYDNLMAPKMAVKFINLDSQRYFDNINELLTIRLPPNPYCITVDNYYLIIEANQYATESQDFLRLGLVYPKYNVPDLKTLGQQLAQEDLQRIRLGIKFFDHLSQGIYFMIDNGIYNLDIKQQNILCHRNGDGSYQVKFGDFGISALTPCSLDLLEKDYLLFDTAGTPTYWPLEYSKYHLMGLKTMFSSLALTIYFFINGSNPTPVDENEPKKYTFESYSRIRELGLNSYERSRLVRILDLINNIEVREIPQRAIAPPSRFSPLMASSEVVRSKYQKFLDSDVPFVFDLTAPVEESNSENERTYALKVIKMIKQMEDMKHVTYTAVEIIQIFFIISHYLAKEDFSTRIAWAAMEVINCQRRMRLAVVGAVEFTKFLSNIDFEVYDCSLSEYFFCFQDYNSIPLLEVLQDWASSPILEEDREGNSREPRNYDFWADPGLFFRIRLGEFYPEIETKCQSSLAHNHYYSWDSRSQSITDDPRVEWERLITESRYSEW